MKRTVHKSTHRCSKESLILLQWSSDALSEYPPKVILMWWVGNTSLGRIKQAQACHRDSDWWLLTDPWDCDWQALTTTQLARASPHCWAQQAVWRLGEIHNQLDITEINNRQASGGEWEARSTLPSHCVARFTDFTVSKIAGWIHTEVQLIVLQLVKGSSSANMLTTVHCRQRLHNNEVFVSDLDAV